MVWLIQGQKFRLWWIPAHSKYFFLILTKHIALIALVGISCMRQKFHTLLILALHWITRIMRLWLQINPFGCVTEKRKPVIWGASLELSLHKGSVTKKGRVTQNSLRTRWREWWKGILSLMLATSDITIKKVFEKIGD